MKKLRNFVAACALAGGMFMTPAPAEADCIGICLLTEDWLICVFICDGGG